MKPTTPPQTEAAFQRQVLQLAALTGWQTAHFRPAQNRKGAWRTPVAGDGAGFPDLVLVRNGHIIFAELKTNTGHTTRDQDAWLHLLTEAAEKADTVHTHVWRPRDWDQIVTTLRTLGTPQGRPA